MTFGVRGQRCPKLWLLVLLAVGLAVWPFGRAGAAESGATLTPDYAGYLVNKDLGTARWTIGLNVVHGNPDRFVNVTGNVFRSDGGAPAFVVCQLRPDSTRSLSDPASTFRLTCSGADACATTAKGCSSSSWTTVADDVAIDAAFFLPPRWSRERGK